MKYQPNTKNLLLLITLTACLTFLQTTNAQADVALGWDANTEPDLVGYNLYFSRTSSVSTSSSVIRIPPTATAYLFETNTHLGNTEGDPIYFALAAVDTSNNVSALTDIIETVDQADLRASDKDKDGLSYEAELVFGTDPNSADSDDDDVDDGQEITDGSDPLDSGSVLPVLDTTICSEWNGFLGMWNILEHVNLSNSPINISLTLKDITGNDQDTLSFGLNPGVQFDVLVHGLGGRAEDSYGNVCITHNGGRGGLDGRMTYYKPEFIPGSSNEYQFAFSMPMNNGLRGSQFVGFNTFQPSLDVSDANNSIANWIQLVNSGNTRESGRLIFYDISGEILANSFVRIEAGSRQDFSGHQFGPSLVGLIEWRPNNRNARFQLRNVRYVYDNSIAFNSFDTAFQLEAVHGTRRTLSAPLDTRSASSIIEVSNVSNRNANIDIDVYSENGEILQNIVTHLTPFATQHFITDSILDNARGTVHITGSAGARIIATVMQYRRTASNAIEYMYGINAKQSLGRVIRGSYNTFLNQDAELWLVNSSNTEQTASLTMVRSDQTTIASGEAISIPTRGLTVLNLDDLEEADNYGVATVDLNTSNTISAFILRRKGLDFVIPTPVRQ